MARLLYSVIASLDGYIEDEDGSFDWAAPDEEVHTFVNDLERSVGTYLYGRRMYEVMAPWETMEDTQPRYTADFANIWRAAEKIVYSKTLALDAVTSAKTRIKRGFDPAAIQEMKAHTDRDLTVGGPQLAAQALHAGLVDEFHLFVVPIIVGGGKPSLPSHLRLKLDLLDERRFRSGVMYLRYRVRM